MGKQFGLYVTQAEAPQESGIPFFRRTRFDEPRLPESSGLRPPGKRGFYSYIHIVHNVLGA